MGSLRLGRYITLGSLPGGFGVHASGIGIIILLIRSRALLGIPHRGRDQLPGHGVSAVPPQPRRTGCWADDPCGGVHHPKRISQVLPAPLLALLLITPLSVLLFNDQRLEALGRRRCRASAAFLRVDCN